MTRLLAGVLVLKLYASDQTSSMKMPWVILILVFPILGVGLYLLIGLNGGTRKNAGSVMTRSTGNFCRCFPMTVSAGKRLAGKSRRQAIFLIIYRKMPPIRSIRIQMLFIMMRQSKGWRLSWQIWQRQRNSFLWNIMPLRMHRPGIKSREFWKTA